MKLSSESVDIAGNDLDLFGAYDYAVQSIGVENAFLLESIYGPEKDCQRSVLGLHRLVEILFSDRTISIKGETSICEFLREVLTEALGRPVPPIGPVVLQSTDEHWKAIRALVHAFDEEQGELRFGYFASIGYDAGRLIESIPARLPTDACPLVTLSLFQIHVVVTRLCQAHIVVRQAPGIPNRTIDSVRTILARRSESDAKAGRPHSSVRFTMNRGSYVAAAERALDHIRAGDIYQIQLGHEIQVATSMSPVSLYAQLRKENPSPYMFLCHIGGSDLIGASPESYVQLDNGTISMRPIAGTVRKTTGEKREEQIAKLVESAKENAEHVMLVDLCRNDIGRVCKDRSMQVPDLMIVGDFANLFHLISTVTGRIRNDCDVVDVIRATFPAGTMVGAPKVRAMEIIENLETSRRGYYAGGIGLVGFGNFVNMALCIRMATRKNETYSLRASAGIVVDSDPLAEWEETLIKMGRMYRALTGEELAA